MMAKIDSLIKRARKLDRRESFLTLLNAIKEHPLSPSKRTEFLGRIMTATLSGDITPDESRKLTKAIAGD